jgi:hypothetical protein
MATSKDQKAEIEITKETEKNSNVCDWIEYLKWTAKILLLADKNTLNNVFFWKISQ